MDRRRFLQALLGGAALAAVPGKFIFDYGANLYKLSDHDLHWQVHQAFLNAEPLISREIREALMKNPDFLKGLYNTPHWPGSPIEPPRGPFYIPQGVSYDWKGVIS